MPKTNELPQTESTLERWENRAKEEMENVKFPPKGQQVSIYPSYAPQSQKVDGRFGTRDMYVLRTNIGNIAYTPTQFLQIVAMLEIRGKDRWNEPLRWP